MKSTKLILTFICLSLASLDFYGQSQDNKHLFKLHRIISNTNKKTPRSPGKILENIVFGRSDSQISRPSDFVYKNQNTGWILSQDNGEIIYFDSDNISRTSIKPKNHPSFISLVSGCYIKGTGLIFTDSATDNVYILNEEGRLKPFTDKKLQRPTGIAYNNITKTLWLVETGAHRISVFNIDGKQLYELGERGTGPGQFNFPAHIDIDNKGFAYIVDAMNFRIQIFSPDGDFISQFGEHGDASGKFARPKGIAVDSHQNIFVADALFNNIQVFDNEGNFLFYFGSRGNDDSEFLMPAGLDIDENDYIYVADSYNNRIQIFKPADIEQDD